MYRIREIKKVVKCANKNLKYFTYNREYVYWESKNFIHLLDDEGDLHVFTPREFAFNFQEVNSQDK